MKRVLRWLAANTRRALIWLVSAVLGLVGGIVLFMISIGLPVTVDSVAGALLLFVLPGLPFLLAGMAVIAVIDWLRDQVAGPPPAPREDPGDAVAEALTERLKGELERE